MDDLRATQDLQHWPELLNRRMAGVVDESEHVCQAAQAEWGSAADRSDAASRDRPAALPEERRPTRVESPGVEIGVTPKAVNLAIEQIVADLCRAPDGILHARARLASWLDAVAALLHDLQSAANGDEANDETHRARLHVWHLAFADAAAHYSQTVALWTRILVAAGLGSLGLTGILWLQRAFELG